MNQDAKITLKMQVANTFNEELVLFDLKDTGEGVRIPKTIAKETDDDTVELPDLSGYDTACYLIYDPDNTGDLTVILNGDAVDRKLPLLVSDPITSLTASNANVDYSRTLIVVGSFDSSS